MDFITIIKTFWIIIKKGAHNDTPDPKYRNGKFFDMFRKKSKMLEVDKKQNREKFNKF